MGEDGRERSEETCGGEARGAEGVLGEEHGENVWGGGKLASRLRRPDAGNYTGLTFEGGRETQA